MVAFTLVELLNDTRLHPYELQLPLPPTAAICTLTAATVQYVLVYLHQQSPRRHSVCWIQTPLPRELVNL